VMLLKTSDLKDIDNNLLVSKSNKISFAL
jgi:hypothetical protein